MNVRKSTGQSPSRQATADSQEAPAPSLPRLSNNQLLDEIRIELSRHYTMRIDDAQELQGGYLNEKWKLVTNQGPLFVKSYHPDRYRKHVPAYWGELERALKLQAVFRHAGGACPALYSHPESGGFLFETPSGRKFVVMEHRPGRLVKAGRANASQMHALGLATAAMHACWNDAAVPDEAVRPLPEPIWRVEREQLLQAWESRRSAFQATTAPGSREAWELQGDILLRFDDAAFREQAPGWTHLDLWADNILFTPDGLGSILDFDRVRYSFPLLDLGRATLSFSLDDGHFRHEAAAALAEGYRKLRPLPKGHLLTAVRHTWLVESFWWFRPGMEAFSAPPRRFAQEMLWTAAQWDELESVLGRI